MTRISPSNRAAVNAALKNSISEKEARELIKNAGGKNKTVDTQNELKQLKAIKSQYAKQLTPAAKAVLEKEIAAATKRAPKETGGWKPSSGISGGS